MNKNIQNMISYSEGGILSKVILTESMNATLFCMAKNTDISEHTSTKKGIVYVIEGEGYFYLEKEKIKMLPGVFIYMKKNQIHSIKVDKNTSFLLILVG